MRDGGDLRTAPSLIDPDGADNVGDQGAGILKVGSMGCQREHRPGTFDIDNVMLIRRRVLNRDRRRHAIAELLRVAISEDAEAGKILVYEVGLQAVFRRVEEVVERRRLAERKPAELDEGAQDGNVAVVGVRWGGGAATGPNRGTRKADRRWVVAAKLPARREVAAQGAPGRLFAHIGRQVGAGASDVI